MPDTPLIAEVRDLNDRLEAVTQAMHETATATTTLAEEYAKDKKFRQRIIQALLVFAAVMGIIALVSGWTAIEVQNDQREERQAEAFARCDRSRALRSDIHAGVDAVLDEINAALPDDSQVELIIARAKAAIRTEIPILDCDTRLGE